ncbi:hypothetical protein [Paenibacillus naphthalenovorans]|uniref:hypothetical protein n=1 Tax=Paenibacillus naphthalenovorans TaxID=162209 RepID=UPI003D2A2A42
MKNLRQGLHVLLTLSILLILIMFLTNQLQNRNYDASWYTALSAVMSGIASIGGLFLLVVTFLYFIETKKMVSEAKRQREILEEPAVSVKITPDIKKSNALNVVIKNTGGGAAYDVSIKFNPDIPYHDSTLNELNMFKKMPLIDKGETIEFFFASAHEYLNSEKPKFSEATLEYYIHPVNERDKSKPIVRKINIDIEERKGQLQIAHRDMHELVNEIEELKHALLLSIVKKGENVDK